MVQLKSLVNNLISQHTKDWKYQLLREWPHIVGHLSQTIRLERVQGTTLVVGVYDHHLLQEMYFLSPTLVDAVNRHMGRTCVHDVRFTVARKKRSQHAVARGGETGQPSTSRKRRGASQSLSSQHVRALGRVKDPDLQEVLRKFFSLCKVE